MSLSYFVVFLRVRQLNLNCVRGKLICVRVYVYVSMPAVHMHGLSFCVVTVMRVKK